MTELWAYRVDIMVPDLDLTGFDVEANDGHIGKIDEASEEAGDAYLVVDTGFWIFGKKRVIPARAVKQIDVETETVFVDLSKDEVKNAPDYESDWPTPDHREQHGSYYDRFTW